MKDKISEIDVFILNIHTSEYCKCSLQELYSMTFPDLCQLHNYIQYRDSIKTLQQHHQVQEMEASQRKHR